MGYREEAIECVKDIVLPIHKQIYAEFDEECDGSFDMVVNVFQAVKERESGSFETCGACPENNTCPKVGTIWQHNPQAKNNLESI